MRASIEALAFDFDGTLADTAHAIVATVAQTLAALGVAQLARDTVVQAIGLPLAHVFITAGVAPHAVDDAVRVYRRYFPENATRVCLYDGTLACLSELRERGLPLAVVSSRGRGSLLPLLEQLGIHGLFREVLGEEDAEHKKPAPDLVLSAARRIGLPAARVLVVGDTTFDIEMGRAAGAFTCAVSHGSHGIEQLRAAGPTWLLPSLATLAGLLGGERTTATEP